MASHRETEAQVCKHHREGQTHLKVSWDGPCRQVLLGSCSRFKIVETERGPGAAPCLCLWGYLIGLHVASVLDHSPPPCIVTTARSAFLSGICRLGQPELQHTAKQPLDNELFVSEAGLFLHSCRIAHLGLRRVRRSVLFPQPPSASAPAHRSSMQVVPS